MATRREDPGDRNEEGGNGLTPIHFTIRHLAVTPQSSEEITNHKSSIRRPAAPFPPFTPCHPSKPAVSPHPAAPPPPHLVIPDADPARGLTFVNCSSDTDSRGIHADCPREEVPDTGPFS